MTCSTAKREEIGEEIKGRQEYLKSVGGLGMQRGGRPRKPEQAAAPAGVVHQARPKAPAQKTRALTPEKVSATEPVLSVIGKSEQGISIDGIMKVSRILYRMKKAGKVKGSGKGVYVKA